MQTRTLPASPHERDASLDVSPHRRADKMIAQASSRNRHGGFRSRSEDTTERWMWRAFIALVMLL
jgi:hypothetical protein